MTHGVGVGGPCQLPAGYHRQCTSFVSKTLIGCCRYCFRVLKSPGPSLSSVPPAHPLGPRFSRVPSPYFLAWHMCPAPPAEGAPGGSSEAGTSAAVEAATAALDEASASCPGSALRPLAPLPPAPLVQPTMHCLVPMLVPLNKAHILGGPEAGEADDGAGDSSTV